MLNRFDSRLRTALPTVLLAVALLAVVLPFALAGSATAQQSVPPFSCLDEGAAELQSTIIVPASVPTNFGGSTLEAGDVIALVRGTGPDASCVNSAAFTGNQFSFTAWGSADGSVDAYDIGETLRFQVYKESEDQIYDVVPTFSSCGICDDSGTGLTFQSNVVYELGSMDGTVIPVELAAFDVALDGPDAVLTWRTASETNNAGFEVQHRRPDADADAASGAFPTAWTPLGFVDGAGTTSQPQRYRFRTGALAVGRHAFRLEQVDFDGTATLGPVRTVVRRLDGRVFLSAAAPQPATTTARFALTVADAQTVTTQVFDLLGRAVTPVRRWTLAPQHTTTLQVNTERLASGTYVVVVRGDAFQHTRRLTVVR